jgi:hypothetical protein
MQRATDTVQRIWADLRDRRHIESYAVAAVSIVLVVLGLFDEVSQDLQLTVILAALALLVFNITVPERSRADLDSVLQDRKSYGHFRDFIHGARSLSIYGPTAITVLREAASIEREVLAKGGTVRVIVQDPGDPVAVANLHRQLDGEKFNVEHDLQTSLGILSNLEGKHLPGRFAWRQLPHSPGFSLVVVERDKHDDQLVVEFYGYNSQVIDDRMHIVIHRRESPYWFGYWADQFETMWDRATAPKHEETA